MERITKIFIKALREVYKKIVLKDNGWYDTSRVQYVGEDANRFVKHCIQNATEGIMIGKFGTIELNAVCCSLRMEQGLQFHDYIDFIKGKISIYPEDCIKTLCINAGFFPLDLELQNRFAQLVLEDIKSVDILGSYIDQERYLDKQLDHCKKIDIYGYCAPFAWKSPWTSVLKGKTVLVVHPFAESIKRQYEKREKLFQNQEVLPEFKKLILIKAVQSIAGNGVHTGYADWFEALEAMKREIDRQNYDIALIGCGAYGMSLAAHCKRRGKIAIHMGSWVQMLFGIYGDRWVNQQPEYAGFINEYWVRPLKEERPQGVEKVENAAYW